MAEDCKELLKLVEKEHGKGSLIRLGDGGKYENVEAIPSGFFGIDLASGIGGFPRGRMIELMGFESTGKTYITLKTIAEAQKIGLTCAFIDAEYSFDKEWAEKNGVDVENLLICQPSSGEQALNIVETIVRHGTVGLIVVDSVAALVPQAELMGEMGESHMGLQARLMSQACRKLTGLCSQNKVSIIFINQIRLKIGGYGNPETTAGGKALGFYSSVRLDIRKYAPVKEGDDAIAQRTRIKFIKNKVAAPYKTCEFQFSFEAGYSREDDVAAYAISSGLVAKGGAWYTLPNGEKVQGKDSISEYLVANPEVMKEWEGKIKLLGKSAAPSSEGE